MQGKCLAKHRKVGLHPFLLCVVLQEGDKPDVGQTSSPGATGPPEEKRTSATSANWKLSLQGTLTSQQLPSVWSFKEKLRSTNLPVGSKVGWSARRLSLLIASPNFEVLSLLQHYSVSWVDVGVGTKLNSHLSLEGQNLFFYSQLCLLRVCKVRFLSDSTCAVLQTNYGGIRAVICARCWACRLGRGWLGGSAGSGDAEFFQLPMHLLP